MPVLLALDTSGPLCSVALFAGGERFVDSRRVERQHNLHVLGVIDGLCSQAGIVPRDLDGIVFIKGPGSFTGVRLAVAVTQGLALAAGARVLGVTTSRALAQYAAVATTGRIATAVRSRGRAFYLAGFSVRNDGPPLREQIDQLVEAAPAWLTPEHRIVGETPPWLPSGWATLAEDPHPAITLLEYARSVWGASGWTAAEGALPVYVQGDHPWQPAANPPGLP